MATYDKPDPKTLRITPEQQRFFAAVGRLVTSFHMLEHFLSIFLGSSLTDDEEDDSVYFVTSNLSFRKLLDCVDYRFRITNKDQGLIDEFEEILGRMQRLEESRNRIVHCLHLVNQDGKVTRQKFVAKRYHGLTVDRTGFSVEQIEDLAAEADVLFLEAMRFRLRKRSPKSRS